MKRSIVGTGPPGPQNDASARARGGRSVPSNGFQKRAQLPHFLPPRQERFGRIGFATRRSCP
jgi:hypothetical protein